MVNGTFGCGFLFVLGCAAAQGPAPIDVGSQLRRMTELPWLWQPPVAGDRCVQFSSFDRRSLQGPADPVAWYANDDRGQYLRQQTRDGVDEFVMADCDGPGCITRIWSANPAGMLHFDIDGRRVWSVDFGKLCRGEVEHVPAPLAAMRSRGGNVYLPIPFAGHLVVSATDGKLYYHVDVAQWPAGTAVTSFSPAALDAAAPAIKALVAAFPTARPAYDHEFMITNGLEPQPPAGTVRLAARDGELRIPPRSLVSEFRLDLGRGLSDAEQAEVLAGVLLVVRCGDEETVRVPLPDFFAAGPDWCAHESRFLTVVRASGPGPLGGDGAFCAFPMPMPDGGSIRLETDRELGAFMPRLRHAFVAPLGDGPALRFHASYHLGKGLPTRPFADHLVLAAAGQGRFVGCALVIRNPSRTWWGEGDEKFTVDGEKFPSWFGTGTEDYFGYAWCDPTPFEAPFHGQVQCDGPRNFGFTAVHRFHVLDSVPFERGFRFDLERWHWVEQLQVDYATVAYWYGSPGAGSGLPPVPDAETRALPKLPPPKTLVAEGAIEGEALRVLRCTGGSHELQDLSFFEGKFSNDAHRWWRDGKVGDELVLAVPVAAAGRYRLTVAMTQADDFGIVQVSLGGTRLGEPIDGFAEQVSSSGPLVLGEVDLPAGEAELRFELVGANARSKPRHMVGLDYLRLEVVR